LEQQQTTEKRRKEDLLRKIGGDRKVMEKENRLRKERGEKLKK